MIYRRYHLGDRACVSNFADAPTRRRGHGRGRPRGGSGKASEKKPDEEEARREVDTRARIPENRGNAGLSCTNAGLSCNLMPASRASEYSTYIYIADLHCSYVPGTLYALRPSSRSTVLVSSCCITNSNRDRQCQPHDGRIPFGF